MWYRAPEILMGVSYATPVDLWAVGCIFAELTLNGKPIFEGQIEMDQLNKIFDVIGTPSEEAWPFESAVLRSNFSQRPVRDLRDVVPELEEQGVDLLKVIIIIQRIITLEIVPYQ